MLAVARGTLMLVLQSLKERWGAASDCSAGNLACIDSVGPLLLGACDSCIIMDWL